MTVRIGILSGKKMAEYKIKAIENAVNLNDATITAVIIDDSESKTSTDHMIQALTGDLWDKYNKLSWKISPPILQKSQDITDHDAVEDADSHYCEPIPVDGVGNRLPTDAVEFAKERCDVLFRDAFGIVKGDILNASEYGVLSYHAGDIREYRGKPPGFWEYMNDEEVCGITLQQLSETLDGGRIAVYKEIDISDLYTWRDIRQNLNFEAIDMLSMAINDIENGDWDPNPINNLGELYTTPNNRTMMTFLYKSAFGHIRKCGLN